MSFSGYMDQKTGKLFNHKEERNHAFEKETELQTTLLIEISQNQKTNTHVFFHRCNLDFFLSRRELTQKEEDQQEMEKYQGIRR